MNTKMKHRATVGSVTAAAAALALLGPVSPAFAGPQAQPGIDAIGLSWDGSEYAAATTESFVGTPVAVPGDEATRTLRVRNDGPTSGTLRAKITDVELRDPGSPDVHHESGHLAPASGAYSDDGDQGDFYDDVELRWNGGSASLSELAANGETPILEVPLGRGESTEIAIGYVFDAAAASGNRANVDPRGASFEVVLSLGGDAESVPPTGPSTSSEPTPDDHADAVPVATATSPLSSGLADTGGSLLWVALASAVLIPLGLLAARQGIRRGRAGRG